MDDKVFAAIVGAVATLLSSLIAAAVNIRTRKKFDQDLARLNSELASNQEQLKTALSKEKSLFDARLEYEFDARKRLYLECEPLLFQASNSVVDAKERIIGMAARAGRGHLTHSGLEDGYYLRTTIFRILQPLVFLTIITKKMSQIDFGLDSSIGKRIAILQTLHSLLSSAFEMAKTASFPLPYDPYEKVSQAKRDKHPEKYVYQGLVMGMIDEVVDHMLDGQSCVAWYRFNKEFDVRGDDAKIFDDLKGWLYLFHPQTRPVLWRILVGYAVCCEFYLSGKHWDAEELKGIFTNDFSYQFDWRDKDQKAVIKDSEILADFLAVRDVLVEIYEKNLRRYRPLGSTR